MQRRDFLKTLGVGAAALALGSKPAQAASKNAIQWKMATAWPKNFPGLGSIANYTAELINKLTDGEIHVTVHGAGEIVPSLEVFDAVSNGTVQMGHSIAYYWKGKVPGGQFFGSVPFGLTPDENLAWLYYGGGMALWEELYAPFGIVPIASANTGIQMAGWFNKEINSLEDLKGLKMRLPGLGGEVLRRAGGVPVLIPGTDMFTAMQSGAIDATDWVGPYNDLAFGLYKIAKYYYYPGWAEPSACMEIIVNKKAMDALPERLKELVRVAVRVAGQQGRAEFDARNATALTELVTKHNVNVKKLPDDVLKKLKELSIDVVAEIGKGDPMAKKIFDSYMAFNKDSAKYSEVTQRAYQNARAL